MHRDDEPNFYESIEGSYGESDGEGGVITAERRRGSEAPCVDGAPREREHRPETDFRREAHRLLRLFKNTLFVIAWGRTRLCVA